MEQPRVECAQYGGCASYTAKHGVGNVGACDARQRRSFANQEERVGSAISDSCGSNAHKKERFLSGLKSEIVKGKLQVANRYRRFGEGIGRC